LVTAPVREKARIPTRAKRMEKIMVVLGMGFCRGLRGVSREFKV